MYRNLLYVIFGFLTMNFSLMAEDLSSTQPSNALYVVPESECDEAGLFQDGTFSAHVQKNSLSITYRDKKENITCVFKAPKDQQINLGIYKFEESYHPATANSGLNLSGYRHYNFCVGEFEIFEIQYDDKGNVIAFAGDFKAKSNKSAENYVRGAVRFNSNFPVDEYFTYMTNPNVNLESDHLLYVRKFSYKLGKQEDIIAKDKRKIYISLSENGGVDLIIQDTESCSMKNKITFHISGLTNLAEQNDFLVKPKPSYANFDLDLSDSDDRFTDRNSIFPPSIYISPKNGMSIKADRGKFTILELVFDCRNNKVLSLAIDFGFQDNHDDIYEGAIRHNSTIPLSFE